MDRKSQTQTAFVAVTVVAFAAAVLLAFVVPGATRLTMVANMGVQTADMMRWLFFALAALSAAVGGYTSYLLARRAMDESRAANTLRLASNYKPPPRDEKNPDVIRNDLRRVAEMHPETKDEIAVSLEQFELLQRHLQAINSIFGANAGIITAGDTEHQYALFETLLQRVIDDTCTDYMTVIYQGLVPQDGKVTGLESYIRRINESHVVRIDGAYALATKTATTVPMVDHASSPTAYANKQLQDLINRPDYSTALRKDTL